jgi:hypothetical protein
MTSENKPRIAQVKGERLATILSGGLLCFGALLPVAVEPFAGTLSFFQLGWFSGLLLAFLGITSIYCGWTGRFRLLRYIGTASVILILAKFLEYSGRISDIKGALVRAQLPQSALADMIGQNLGFEWGGWLPLFLAALILTIQGFTVAERSNRAPLGNR